MNRELVTSEQQAGVLSVNQITQYALVVCVRRVN